MSKLDIVRAWKDESYRSSLSAADLALLPANPAGIIELTDAELGFAAGGRRRVTGTGNGSCFCSPTQTGTGSGRCRCFRSNVEVFAELG